MQKNLVFHVYPVASNDAWRWNMGQLRQRLPLFDGKRTIAVAVDDQTDDLATVKDYLQVDGIEWIELENDPVLSESATWVPLWESVKEEPGVTFRAHAKGVTETDKEQTTSYGQGGRSVTATSWRSIPTAKHRMESMRMWTDLLYRTNLDHWELVEGMLERKPMVGSFRHDFRRVFRGVIGPAKTFLKAIQPAWYFMGSFYWVQNRDFFARNWRAIPQTYSGVEVWPGLNFSVKESGCLFFSTDRGVPMNQIEYVKMIREKFLRWERNEQERFDSSVGHAIRLPEMLDPQDPLDRTRLPGRCRLEEICR